MSMEAVFAQMRQTRTELQLEIDALDKMMKLYEERHPETTSVKPLTNDSHRARSGDKDAQRRLNQRPKQQKSKKEYKVSTKIFDDLVATATEMRDSGQSFVESIPGSFTAKQLAEKTGHHIGTVRKAMKQAEERGGPFRKADRLGWRQLGDRPRGATDVFVFSGGESTSEEAPTRTWRRSNGGSDGEANGGT